MRMARNIYHRKDGRFEGRYANGQKSDGKTKYNSVYGKTYHECREKLKIAKSNADIINVKSKKVSELVRIYIEAPERLTKQSTKCIYLRYLKKYIEPYFIDIKCNKITLHLLQNFTNKLIEKGLSARTIHSIISLLKSSLMKENSNIFLQVSIPKKRKKDVYFFSIKEQKKIEVAAKVMSENDYIVMILSLYAGLRIGEICGLQKSDLNLCDGLIYIKRTMQRVQVKDGIKKTKLMFLSPKSLSSKRVIPMPDFVITLLKNFCETSDCDFIISQKGKPIEPRTLQNHFKKICQLANVRNVNFHSTRHSFAVRALENGFDIKTLSEILGHSNASVTLSYYSHATDAHKRECMKALSSVYLSS